MSKILRYLKWGGSIIRSVSLQHDMPALPRTRTCLSSHEQDASPEKYIYIYWSCQNLFATKSTQREEKTLTEELVGGKTTSIIFSGITVYLLSVPMYWSRTYACTRIHTPRSYDIYIPPLERRIGTLFFIFVIIYISIDRSDRSTTHPPSLRWRRTGEPTAQHRTPPLSNINSSSFLYQK